MSHKSIDVMLNQHPSEPRLVGEDFGLGSRLPVYPSSYPYDNIVSRNTDNRGQETDMDRNADGRRKSDTLSYIHPKESIQHNYITLAICVMSAMNSMYKTDMW